MSEREPDPPQPAPLRGAARALALAWLVAVTALYVAAQVFDLRLIR